MFQQLATRLREQLNLLVDQYDERLRTVPGYANLPEAVRHDLEWHVLQLTADSLEANDDRQLIRYIRERAEQVLTHGFQPEWFQQAVTIPLDIIIPLVETVVETHFVWRTLSNAQAAVWQIVAQERNRIEVTLRESEARYQTIFDSTPIMFWLKDTQNRTLRINKAAAAFEGVNPADVEGKSAYDLYPREQAEAFYQDDLAVIRSNQSKLGIIEQHTSVGTGQLMWVETGKTPVRNDQGEILGVLAFAIDITDRQQAAARLHESEQQYRKAITAAGAVPYYIDYTTESYQFIGEAIEHLTGYQAEEITPTLLGQMIQETVMTGLGRDLARDEAIHKAREGDLSGWNADYRLIDRAGHMHWLNDSSVQVLNDHGKPIGAIGILQDITARKQLEQQTQESLERRGRQVQISTEVAQEIASATDEKELSQRVVTLIKERFNYYHAQLFRYEAAQNAVVLIAGYGGIGQKMLKAGHKLQMGRGVVGTAATSGKSILATDVAKDSDWRPNPNLPDTRGELAVPIKWRAEVLGILDVQSNRAGELTDDDRLLLEGLCGQIGTAMESQRLLEDVQRSEADLSTALQLAKLGYWEYDVEKDMFLFNDQFYSIFHTTVEREGGYQLSSTQYAQRFVHRDDMPLVGAEIEKALTSIERHYSRQLEHRILYADGGVGHISVNVNVDRDEQGRIIRFNGANQDITARKQTEQQMQDTLLEMERLYAAVSHEAWQQYREAGGLPQGYLFNRSTLESAEQIWEPEIGQAVTQQALVTEQSDQRSVAVAPLSVRGEVIGALGVYDDPQQPLKTEDLAMLEAVSEQVALALESARLFEQNQLDAQREHTINRVTSRIRNARSVDEVLSIAVQELRLATRASRSVLEILPDADQLVRSGKGEGAKA